MLFAYPLRNGFSAILCKNPILSDTMGHTREEFVLYQTHVTLKEDLKKHTHFIYTHFI
jgi:hypothetical protein